MTAVCACVDLASTGDPLTGHLRRYSRGAWVWTKCSAIAAAIS
jgi:hypothetical protein